MGKQNVQTKLYMSDNEKFADLCNYYIYDGRQVILPEQLEEQDTTELAFLFRDKSTLATEKIRDLLKKCALKSANGIAYLIVGVENQAEIHYAMVIRNMLYDALNYSAQASACASRHRKEKNLRGAEFLSGFAKEDKLHPVITITVYWNAGKWDGPRSLHEMLAIKDKRILRYVENYHLHLLVPDEITDFKKFKTELGPVLEFFQCADDKEKLNAFLHRDENLTLSDEALRLLKEYEDVDIKTKKGTKTNMCKAWEDVKKEAAEKGIEKTKLETAKRMFLRGTYSLEEISDISGLALEEVKKLQSRAK